MSLSEDTFSESSTNSETSDDLTSEETISANPQRQQPFFSGPLPIAHGQAVMVSHPRGSMPIFSVGPSFQTGVNRLHGSIPIFSAGSSIPTEVNRPRDSISIFSIGSASHTQAQVNHPRGNMPIFSAGSSSRIRNEVAQDSPSVGRPIVNGLYDPNFALIGLPVDPFLRQFMSNPDFGNKRK